MAHTCSCQTSRRRIGLVFGGLVDNNRELADAIERFGWSWDGELGTAVAEVGPGTRFDGVAAVFDLVAGLVGEPSARDIRATWLEDAPLGEQTGRLLRAGPMSEFIPRQDSPLAGLLEARALETWFQPVVDAASEAIVGHECLVRAYHPEDGRLITPGDLIGWAREENLLFMFDRVCREIHIARAAASGAGPDHMFLINFLPSVIYEPEFCLRTTVGAIEGTGLRPEQIVFEVVETEAIEDHEHLRNILCYYRSNGFRAALDDVGAGYSGLSLIADLDPDLIKIDRGLVANADRSAGHAEVCRAIIGLARSRGRQVLAEGIETASQRDFMRTLGVDLMQGYFFGRPAAGLTTG
ncbi:MAG: EAL domain-containing protein [Halofilum sp. (in: g-proteobacteria)]|nr:EAL domain-containing protein [Halofilum sp. (in: g-proteobacteria)]